MMKSLFLSSMLVLVHGSPVHKMAPAQKAVVPKVTPAQKIDAPKVSPEKKVQDEVIAMAKGLKDTKVAPLVAPVPNAVAPKKVAKVTPAQKIDAPHVSPEKKVQDEVIAMANGMKDTEVAPPVSIAAAPKKVAILQVQVTPIAKVVALLEGMLEKGKKDKHSEETQFAEFMAFCADVLQSKEFAIGEETANIDHLTVDIRQERARAQMKARDMARLDSDISNWEGDKKAATNVRTIEKNDYDALYEDYSDTVDALMRAIATLKKQKYDRKAHSSAMQMSALQSAQKLMDTSTKKTLNAQQDMMYSNAKKAIDVFLQQGEHGSSLEPSPSLLATSAPGAHGYEFQSAGIVEMLQKLLDKFMDERRAIAKGETASRYAYELLMQDLAAEIAEATKRREQKSLSKAKQLEMKADDKEDRNEEWSLKSSDSKYKTDLQATCRVKKSAFKSRQRLRVDEIFALEKAIKIVSSDQLEANAVKHLPSMVQQTGSAFAQLRASSKIWNPVATYLQEQAVKLNSRVLATIAEHVATDPFIKVKKMLKDLLTRLMEEANEEVEHKGWCDTELATNAQTRKEKTVAVETLQAEIDQVKASITKITEDISELTKALAELDAAMAEQTTLRQEEKAKNKVIIADTTEAQVAVEQALTVLREFYVKAGEATAFVQDRQDPHTEFVQNANPETPEIFDASYTGMQGKSDEVLGMLEVIQTDFARLESATKAAELSGQTEYDAFMTDSKADKSAKTTNLGHKEAKKVDENHALTTKSADLVATQKELDAAFVYFDKLQPSCVDSGEDFEDRVAQRKEEIASLEEALNALNGNAI